MLVEDDYGLDSTLNDMENPAVVGLLEGEQPQSKTRNFLPFKKMHDPAATPLIAKSNFETLNSQFE